MSRSRRGVVAAVWALALISVWGGLALYQHRAQGGVVVEVLLLGALFAPAHLRRALRLSNPSVAAADKASDALEALTLLLACSGQLSPLLYLASLRAARDLVGARGGPDLGRTGDGLTALALGVATLTQGVALDRDMVFAPLELTLLVPAIVEACLPGRDRGAEAVLRRVATGGLFVLAAGLRLDHLLGVGICAIASAAAILAAAVRRHDAATWRRAWRRRVFKAAAPGACCLLVLGAGELTFLATGHDFTQLVPPDAGAGTDHLPGQQSVYVGAPLGPRQATNVVTWNRDGWHDVDHDLTKAPGVTRILVLGDSYVEGRQVALDQLYHRQLEARLHAAGRDDIEVIGVGQAGWGQADELRYLRKSGWDYAPDLVLVELLCANDIRNNHPGLQTRAVEQTTRSSWARPLFADALRKRLAFTAWLCDRLDQLWRARTGDALPLDLEVYLPPDARWSEAWDRTRALLQELHAEVEARGIGLAVVVFTGDSEIRACLEPDHAPPGGDYRAPARRATAICAELGIPLLDLAPALAEYPAAERAQLHIPGDGHWSATGHAAAADVTAVFLQRRGLLPTREPR